MSNNRASKLREDLNITTPESMVIGFNQQRSINHDEDYASNQKSIYSDLQYKIDKNRKLRSLMGSPPSRQLTNRKITIETSNHDNFTDITKVRPNEELAPLNLKNKLNLETPPNIHMTSNKDVNRANNHTTGFLYSKIPNKPVIKKSSIVPGTQESLEADPKAYQSSKLSFQHKSTASSLIAALGQRKRDPKSVNSHPVQKHLLTKSEEDRLDATPRISVEKVSWYIYSVNNLTSIAWPEQVQFWVHQRKLEQCARRSLKLLHTKC